MKLESKPCQRWRESISLLASGVLAGQEKAAVEGHLTACPNCRERFAEMQNVSVPLAGWERNFTHAEPSRLAQLRWAKAIHQVANHRSQLNWIKFSFDLLWRELIWPCRRTWAGLAAVWLGILMINHSQVVQSQTVIVKSTAPSGEMRLAFREQRRVLAEIIGPSLLPSPAEPPRRPNNQPRSERRSVGLA